MQPVLGPVPVLRKQPAMVQQHLVRFDLRHAETGRQRRGLHAVLDAEAQHLEPIADRLDARRLARGVGRDVADDLSEIQIGIAAAVEVEHRIVRAGVPVRQRRGAPETPCSNSRCRRAPFRAPV